MSQRLSDRISALLDFAEAQKLQILPVKEFQIGFTIIFNKDLFKQKLNVYLSSNDIISSSMDSFTEALGSSVASSVGYWTAFTHPETKHLGAAMNVALDVFPI